MTALAGLALKKIEELLSPMPRFRANQIYKWILKGCESFEEMKNIPVSLQKELSQKFCVYSGRVIDSLFDEDNTRKNIISLKDGLKIESVLLCDNKNRLTACLSTQAGCPCGCVFCKTGAIGFKRNLESCEIVEQFLQLKTIKNERISSDAKNKEHFKKHLIDNIVIMGMGEPLLNIENLYKAVEVFTDPKGINLSRRRITVSTCGIYDGLLDIANNGSFVRLALSLVTADESLRQKLLPVTKANPLEKIREVLLLYQKNGGGRITLEVPLLGGINTREKDALSVINFSKGLESVINIIPWNPVADLYFEGKPLAEPSKKEISDYTSMLEKNKLNVTMRLHKGRSLMGACGQLGDLLGH